MEANTPLYRGVYVILGPPGTGKTSRMAASVKKICTQFFAYPGESQCVVCSLTRAAAHEATGRMVLPDGAVATLHSLCYRGIKEESEAPKLIKPKDISEGWNKEHPTYQMPWKQRNFELDQVQEQISGETLGQQIFSELEILRHRMTPPQKWGPSVHNFADKWTSWKRKHGLADFTDLIDLAPPTAPFNPRVVICDEAQDMSLLELSVLQRWGKAAGGFYLAGDPRQSPYVWRGAHPQLLLDPSVPDDHRQVLPKSYRLPRKVHAFAERFVSKLSDTPPMQYTPRDADGVLDSCEATVRAPWQAIQKAIEYIKQSTEHTAQLTTTCGYMLKPLIRMLRADGIPFANPWRTTDTSWNPLGSRQSKVQYAADIVLGLLEGRREDKLWTYKQVHGWTKAMASSSGVLQHGAKMAIQQSAKSRAGQVRFEDMLEWFQPGALQDLWTIAFDGTDEQLIAWWSSKLLAKDTKRFQYPLKVLDKHGEEALRQAPRLFIGTCHSFKGSTCEAVWLFPELSPRAWQNFEHSYGEPRDAVIRTLFVGMTRAREQLHLCQRAFKGVSWNHRSG